MNLTIKNLSYATPEVKLESEFSKFGEVRAVLVVKDYFKGKATGFVSMVNESHALRAFRELNGKSILGQKVTIEIPESLDTLT